jgi:hypothetical protein
MNRASSFYDNSWNGQLVRRQPKRLAREASLYAFHFKQNSSGLNHRYPHFRGSLAFSHSGFRWLFGQGFVREDPDPDFSASLEIPR